MTECQILKVRRPRDDMDYGQLEFGIRDRDGYILAFAEPDDEK